MKGARSSRLVPRTRVPAGRYPGLAGKVVQRVEHNFEEGRLDIQVRFTDNTELCWRIAADMTIEMADLADWTSGNFKRLRAFVSRERESRC